ncbi:MAG: hypothetical protein WCW44_02305 [archaeon]|jgi:hypothetical protein
MNKTKIIVCDPEPFCFGPSADIFGVCKVLAKQKHVKVIVLATKKVYSVFKHEPKLNVVFMKYPKDNGKLKKIVSSADAYVTATNNTNLDLIKSAGIKTPVVYLDSLFWYWGNEKNFFSKNQREADLYLACNYFNSAALVKKQKKNFKNLKLIPPIIASQKRKKTKDQLFVNFGGLTSRFTSLKDAMLFVDLICKIFFHNLRLQERFDRVIVSGNYYAMRKMKEINTANNIEFLSVNHDNFIKILGESRLFITNPGIHALYEGFASKTPTMGFFPSNLTQALQLNHISKEMPLLPVLDWSLMDKDFNKKMNRGIKFEGDCIKTIKGYIHKLSHDENAYNKLIVELNIHFPQKKSFLELLRKSQNQYVEKITLNGAKEIVRLMRKEGFI